MAIAEVETQAPLVLFACHQLPANKAQDYLDADRVGGVLKVENYSVVVSFLCPRKQHPPRSQRHYITRTTTGVTKERILT